MIKKCHIAIGFIFMGLMACKTKNLSYDEILFDQIEKGGFNGNVLVFEKGEINLKKAFGLANINNGDSLKIGSIFRLGSVSKQFTAMAVAILEEDGVLSYDQNIQDFIAELPYTGITVENLLLHTSGLPDYLDLMIKHWKPELEENDPARYISGNGDIVQMMIEKTPEIHFEPGQKWEYSNTGYVLLATIVESVSRKPFEVFLKERIFEPVGMTNTSVYKFVDGQDPKMPLRVFGFSEENGERILHDSHFLNFAQGDGGVYSTLEDLLRWDRILHTDELVTAATLDRIFTAGKLNNGEALEYGFGWFLDNTNPRNEIVYHGGGWVGFGTYIYRDISRESCFIVLTNNSNWQEVETLVEKFKTIMAN